MVPVLDVDPVIHTLTVHLVPLCTQAAFVVVIVSLGVVFVVLVKVVDQLTVLVDTEDGQQVVFVLHKAEPLDEKTDTLDFVVDQGSLKGALVKD